MNQTAPAHAPYLALLKLTIKILANENRTLRSQLGTLERYLRKCRPAERPTLAATPGWL